MDLVRVCGIGGSLRKGSYNRALIQAALEEAPQGMSIVPFDRLGEIPLYNPDVDAAGTPEPAVALKAAIAEADALPGPDFILPRCADKFDMQGRLTDESTREILRQRLRALLDYTVRMRATAAV